jgi:hypothetical protein
MDESDLGRLPADALWKANEVITETLATCILAEKQKLDAKLELLHRRD